MPEGIDPALPRAAEQEVLATADGKPPGPVLALLAERLGKLAPERQGLPLLVAVGRLHPIKGAHRLVRAWADDPGLRRRFNLLLVGGNLERPSPLEARTS